MATLDPPGKLSAYTMQESEENLLTLRLPHLDPRIDFCERMSGSRRTDLIGETCMGKYEKCKPQMKSSVRNDCMRQIIVG